VGKIGDALAAAEAARQPTCLYTPARMAELDDILREAVEVFGNRGFAPWPFYQLSTRQVREGLTTFNYRRLDISGWPIVHDVDEGSPTAHLGAISVDAKFYSAPPTAYHFERSSKTKLRWRTYSEVTVEVDAPPPSDALAILAFLRDPATDQAECLIHGVSHPCGGRKEGPLLPAEILYQVVYSVEALERYRAGTHSI
jgi:hypothetical protein